MDGLIEPVSVRAYAREYCRKNMKLIAMVHGSTMKLIPEQIRELLFNINCTYKIDDIKCYIEYIILNIVYKIYSRKYCVKYII